MPDRARLAAHSAGQQNEFKTFLAITRENTSKDNAVLGITGSIDSEKKSPFSLDKNRVGGSPPLGKMSRENFLIGGTADVQPPMLYCSHDD